MNNELYMLDLKKRIKRAWYPPKGQEFECVAVTFTVHKSGKATDLLIKRTSGVALVERAALTAVHNATPFRPLPESLGESREIQFVFEFSLSAESGKATLADDDWKIVSEREGARKFCWP